jgi:hypothetical protein
LEQVTGNRVNLVLLPALFLPGQIEGNLPVFESEDMDQFMDSDIQQQRAQLDKRMGPVHGIEDPVVLETDPVKMKTPLLPRFLFPVMILAEVGEGLFSNLMIIEKGQGLDVVGVRPDLFRG